MANYDSRLQKGAHSVRKTKETGYTVIIYGM